MEYHEHKSHLSRQVERSEEEKKKQRKRNLLLLILDYLDSNGYLNSAAQLKAEVGMCITDFKVCDNINLEIILQDFEAYYSMRYQTHVQIAKKNTQISKKEDKSVCTKKTKVLQRTLRRRSVSCEKDIETKTKDCKEILPIHSLGPYATFDLNNEWRILAENVYREMLIDCPAVAWDDVIGHEHAKQRLKESLVYPVKYPDLYSIVMPWKGLFLYGPSGTGKTMLAKATAWECGASFFSVSPASFTSKWRGESEKMIRILFDLALTHAPSIIFIDEIDSLMSQRFAQEHEASRRFKSELLSQIEGLKFHEESIFIFAASNFPWDIDIAMLRRLEQRVYVPLPSLEEREEMLRHFLPTKLEKNNICLETKLSYEQIAAVTEGYSGSDLQVLAKEVKMNVVRNVIHHLESVPENLAKVSVPVIETGDVLNALSKIKPVHLTLMKRYEDFRSHFDSSQ